jgi:hypothetical protein
MKHTLRRSVFRNWFLVVIDVILPHRRGQSSPCRSEFGNESSIRIDQKIPRFIPYTKPTPPDQSDATGQSMQ